MKIIKLLISESEQNEVIELINTNSYLMHNYNLN